MVAFRKNQGYNTIAMIAGFPHWGADGFEPTLLMDDEEKTPIRQAWQTNGSSQENFDAKVQAKEMYNEGGRPFEFPGKVPGFENVVPDYEQINPEYFKYMDRKIAYLSEQGFVSFIEVARRDVSPSWKKYYRWTETYSRYIKYIFTRYQSFNTLLSPIHYDYEYFSIPSREYNAPANKVIEDYGPLPFGNLSGTNAAPSSLLNFGLSDEAKWLTFHQVGNLRPHTAYWYLTEIFNAKEVRPALNGEPYYPGFPDDNPHAPSKEAERNCRSGMYGSFLSGGLAGYFYGCEGIWGGNIEQDSNYLMWDALKFESGDQVRHLKTFVTSKGALFQNLVPESEMLLASRTAEYDGYTKWAYCAYLENKEWVLMYFEEDSSSSSIRSILPNSEYVMKYYNPRTGEWLSGITVKTDQIGFAQLPPRPTNEDWAASLELR
jgi:hypothetical protein